MLRELARLPEVQRLEALATRIETPSGAEAPMVWRRWGAGEGSAGNAGGQAGPPLVLLHGGSGSWMHWLRNIDALARHYTVYAADLPGCGESGLPPGGRDADSIYETVAAGIAELTGGAPVELVAFSFGTLVAGFISAHQPQRVKRLHLVGCAGLGLTRPRLFLQSLPESGDPDASEAVVRHNMLALMVKHPQTLDDQALSLHYANLLQDRLRRRRISRTPVTIELQAQWKCPVRAIWGEGDILIRNDGERLREAFAGCDLRDLSLVEDAGHWVQYERAEAFNRLLLRNLAAADD